MLQRLAYELAVDCKIIRVCEVRAAVLMPMHIVHSMSILVVDAATICIASLCA